MALKVLLTGGNGFLGSYVNQYLEGGYEVYIPRSSQYNLIDPDDTWTLFKTHKPDIVINLAANVGGIGYNQNHPYSLYYDNLLINTHVAQAAIDYNVKEFIQVGTVCSYPKFSKPPFKEEMLWDGYPEETNAPYGLAKKMALVQLEAAYQEFNFPSVYLIISNLYGPGDEFRDEKSHVIPALIKRFINAKNQELPQVEVWGTGNASRDFLFVEDAAKAIVKAIGHSNRPIPINIGSGLPVRIAVLVEWIKELTEYEGSVHWDTAKPDGQPQRGLNTDRAKRFLDWEAEVSLKEGLRRTVEWYKTSVAE